MDGCWETEGIFLDLGRGWVAVLGGISDASDIHFYLSIYSKPSLIVPSSLYRSHNIQGIQ